ncbi:hypothetical protein Pmani_015830 [Petrolisthes manimaculis]|uniref:Uncharacterized protein n=1 Tax=Petrolisthes manimaculis TaxID=1843537 RepID=A0AAE1PR94_9EUCA|nr:hypothetical protein Pmani_015830 [Petrolisthes manimaculis]
MAIPGRRLVVASTFLLLLSVLVVGGTEEIDQRIVVVLDKTFDISKASQTHIVKSAWVCEALANNRTIWRAKIMQWVPVMEQDHTTQRTQKRQQRHANREAPTNRTPGGYVQLVGRCAAQGLD